MSFTTPRKRPCGICRKWFLPNVRQAGRQKACSPECSKELHRRNCADWNKAYFKSNYLDKKLEKDCKSPPDSTQPDVKAYTCPIPKSRINMNVPRDIMRNKIGGDNLIIIEYLIEQIFRRIRSHPAGFP